MIRVVLFDIDGTLIRTRRRHRGLREDVRHGIQNPSRHRHLNFAGRTDTALVQECFQAHGIPPTPRNFRRFFENYVFWLDQFLNATNGSICPCVRQCLRAFVRLPNPPLLGLLTGNIRLGAEIKLRHFKLWDAFRLGAFGDDHEDRNELARIAQKRASQTAGRKIAGPEILVVGDTPLDIQCGNTIRAKSSPWRQEFRAKLRAHRPAWLMKDLSGSCRRNLRLTENLK